MTITSKITFVAVASVVTVMVGVVIAASLGTQDDVSEATEPESIHAPSETPDTDNGTSGTLAEPQGNTSQTTVVGNETSDTLAEPQGNTSQTTEPPAQSDEFEVIDTVVDKDITKPNLPKIVDVGLMNPATGELTGKRVDDVMARLGLADFNSYLERIGTSWRMNLVEKSTVGDPIVALEKIQQLDSEGINLVLGPISNAEVRYIKSYVDSNDMVLISSTSSSSSSSLAVVDNIFRFSPDNNQHGNVLSLLFEQKGIEAVIPIYRGDAWGDGLYASTKNIFETLGGVMDDGIRYSPESTAYSAEVTLLSDLVDKYTDQYPADKIAVLMIGFSETVRLLDSADSFDNLHNVRWFGTDGSSLDNTLSDDPTASTFLQDVNFVSTLFDISENDVYPHVQDRFMTFTTQKPDVKYYYFSIYDSVWVLGKTILETDSIDPLTVRDAITDVASRHTGTIGTMNLNELGDFATPSYDLWSIRDGQWYVSGYFDADSGTFSFT